MVRYTVGRLIGAIPLVVVLSVVTFALLSAAPGDPAAALLQSRAGGAPPRPEDVERVRHTLGLDRPWPERYVRWALRLLRGDFGTSYLKQRPVRALLRDTLPPTLLLTTTALALTAGLALVLGVVAGLTPGSWLARAVSALVLLLYSVPTFLIGLMAVLLFSVRWGLLPSSGMSRAGAAVTVLEVLHHLILPALVLAIGHHLAAYIRLVEVAVNEVRHAPFVQSAVARGLPGWMVVLWYVIPHSLPPFIAQLGTSLGSLVGGAYAVEVIFSWPGVGRAAMQAAAGRDYPVLMAIVLITGIAVVAGNVLADVLVAALDPRVRAQWSSLPAAPTRGGELARVDAV
ncbi:MAG: hypothetical protein C4290_03370 [Chloroflexota bacterium]